jgi:hypothetical protein
MAMMQRRWVQRKAHETASAASARARIPEGSGAQLDEGVRGKMEGQLGADLSSVRVHTGSDSSKAAKGMGARAFTVGADIHFNHGEFNPGSKEGDRLIAHELAHVVQGQKAGVQRKPELGAEGKEEVSHPDDPAEQEADAAADQVTAGLHGEGGDKPVGKSIGASLRGVGRKIYRNLEGADKVGAEAGAALAAGNDAKNFEGESGPDDPVYKETFAKAAQEFETKLGLAAMDEGSAGMSCAKALLVKIEKMVKAIADKETQSVGTLDKKFKGTAEQLLPKLCGNAAGLTTIAGAVGGQDETTKGAVQQVFTEGNLRERMTVLFNFAGPFSDFLQTYQGDMDAFLQKAELEEKTITDALTAAAARQEKIKSGEIKKGADDRGKRATLIDSEGRDNLVDQQTAARTKRDEGDPEKPASRTVEDNPELKLSDRELKYQGLNKPAEGDEEKKEDGEAPAEGAEATGESGDGQAEVKQALGWHEGIQDWRSRQGSAFAERLQQLNMPFAAGPSGTTDRLMKTADLLGGSDKYDVRAACIGYLLPIRAHSLYEVLFASQNQGCTDFKNGPQMYSSIEPWKTPQLREIAGGKLPHEAAEEAMKAAQPSGEEKKEGEQAAPPAADPAATEKKPE